MSRGRQPLRLIIVSTIVLWMASSGWLIASVPSVITSSPTSVTGYGAVLNGSVNPGNEVTTVTCEYSTNGDFPSDETPAPTVVAADQSPISGGSYVAVSCSLTGLTPGVVYYYRLVAANGSGTTEGSVQHFQTVPPPTVATGIASPVTTTTAQLNGVVNANGNTATVTFEYGITTSYGTTVTAVQSPVTGTTDTAVSVGITGLSPNTVYHYRVVGDNILGTSRGADVTFFTSAPAAPTVATEMPTFSAAANTATLNGIVNANNDDAAVTFEYGTTTAYGSTVAAAQSPVLGSTDTAVSAYVTGLTAGTTYHYRVVASNGQGTSAGADMTFLNTTAPYARTEPAAAIGRDSARLVGTVNPKTFEASPPGTTVTFEYGLDTSYGSTVTAIESPIGGPAAQTVNFDVDGLAPNTTYHYRVVASNLNGTGTGEDVTFTTSSLPVATTETAAPVGATGATLNGTVNANGDSTTVTFEYGLDTSYGTTVTADQSPVTGTSDTAVSRAITGLTDATTYHSRVVATNSSGTVFGEDLTFTTGISPPSATTDAPTGIAVDTATLNGTVNANGFSTDVRFEWGLTTDYERTDSANPGTVTGTSPTAVSFTPTGLSPNATYRYRVVAENAGGTIRGAERSFTTLAAPTVTTREASLVTTTGGTLNGTVNANGQTATVTFEYGVTTAYGTTVTADQSPVTGSTDTAVSRALTGLTPGIVYHYRVVGQNASGTSYGDDRTFSTSVGPPVVTTGGASPLVTGAIVSGTVNAQNASTTVTVEYGTTLAYGSSVVAAPSPVTGSNDVAISATLSGLSFNTTYNYRVVGTNANGTSYGANETFRTSLNPSARTGPATDVLATSAVVTGVANGNNGSWSTRFDYGTTVAYGSSQAATPSVVSGSTDTPLTATLTGLAPSTTYHYRAVVYSGGITYPGADMTFTTAPGPTVVTTAANPVGATSATLNGTVNANGQSTDVTFDFGETTSYDRSISAAPSPVSGSTDTAVSAVVAGLLPGTTYHYRAVGSVPGGTVVGADTSFTTSSAAPAATTVAATFVGGSGATVNGLVNANNTSTTVTFEYGLDTTYGSTVTADQSPVTGVLDTAVSATLSGLATGQTYHYRVVAQSSSGTTYGGDLTFITGIAPPTAVTGTASGVGITTAVLSGLVNANGASTTVTFEYGTTTSYSRSVPAIPDTVTGTTDTAVTAALTDLVADTTYHYRVAAVSAGGTTYGGDMTFTTNPAGTPTVTTAAVTSVAADSATGGGNVTSEGTAPVTARGVCWATTPAPTTADSLTVDGGGGGAFVSSFTGLAPLTTYHVRAYATNFHGTVYGEEQVFETLPLAPVAETDPATAVGGASAILNGRVNANDASTTVTFEYGLDTGYGSTATADQSPVAGSTETAVSAAVAGLLNGATYHFRVVATNAGGTTSGADQTFTTDDVPGVTTNAATAVSGAGATLNGLVEPNGDDTTATFEYGLDIGYGSTVTADQSPVGAAAGATAVSATLAGLTPGTTYHFRAVGQNAVGTSQGADLTFTTHAAPAATTTAASAVGVNDATLNGLVNPNGEDTTVTFEYGRDASYGNTVVADQSPISGDVETAVSARIGGLRPGSTYHARVVAENSLGTTYGEDVVFTTQLPSTIPTLSRSGALLFVALLMLLGWGLLRSRLSTM